MSIINSNQLASSARALALVLALGAGSVAFAQDGTAEDDFHRAYELEVVEGKVSDAARAYLDLARAESTPARIRAESRFRFAVCSALLGRSDEARSLLSELAADESASDSIRARAREYRAAIEDVGIGTELDKKLQELVFALGREQANEFGPSSYRDFEIIGDPARPLLRSLLEHDDGKLRGHAFRLLCRMNEPGMASAWSVDLSLYSFGHQEFETYLSRHDDERAAFESMLLELDAEALAAAIDRAGGEIVFTEEFVQRCAERRVAAHSLLTLGTSVRFEPERRWEMLSVWATGDDEKLAQRAIASQINLAFNWTPEGGVGADTYLRMHRHLLDTSSVMTDRQVSADANVLSRLSMSQSHATLLDALEQAIAHTREWTRSHATPLERGLGALPVRALHGVETDAATSARYADLVRQWIEVDGPRTKWAMDALQQRELRIVLSRISAADADALVGSLIESADGQFAQNYLSAMPFEDAAAGRALLSRIRDLDAAQQLEFLGALAKRDQARSPKSVWTPSSGFVEVIVGLFPEIVQGEPSHARHYWNWYARALGTMDSAGAANELVEFVRSTHRLAPQLTHDWANAITSTHVQDDQMDYVRRAFVPALPGMFDAFESPKHRTNLVRAAVSLLLNDDEKKKRLGDSRQAVAAFVLEHCDTQSGGLELLASHPDEFPLEEWAARVRPPVLNTNMRQRLDPDAVAAAARTLTADAQTVDAAAVTFVRLMGSNEVQREIFDRLLRAMPIDRVAVVTSVLMPTLGNCSVDAVEDAMRRLMAADDIDLNALMNVTDLLQRNKPSEELFPAARRLLASDDHQPVYAGIALAAKLGRTDLVPDLVGKLDSLDNGIRTAAREAIDSIVELERLRDEARSKYGSNDDE